MSTSNDATRALEDARLLLETFMKSPWRSLEVDCGALRLSISRLSAVERAASRASAVQASDLADDGPVRLTAPHVATLRELAAVGALIRAGEPYATLELLDEPLVLRADHPLRPVSLLSQPGDLVEFGSPLMAVQLADG